MQLSTLFTAAMAFAIAQAATFTMSQVNPVAGQPYTLTWSNANGPVTINLKNGPSTALVTVETIISGQTGTSFTWTPENTLPNGVYAFEIIDSTGTPNYSLQFTLTTGVTSSAASTGASSTVRSSSGSSVLSSTATSSVLSSTVSSRTGTSSTVASTTSGTSSSASSSATESSSNTTSSKTSSTSTKTSTSTSSTGTATTPPNSSANNLASPLAFVLLAVAALFTLN